MQNFYGESGLRSQTIGPGLAARLAGNVLLHLTEYNAPQVAPEDRLLHNAITLLSDDLSNPPAIAAVALQLNISREYLTRLFSARMGLAPAGWLREERLRHAELLLQSGSDSVAQIANAVGFQSASAFIAAFRQHFSHTPKQWRKQHFGVDLL